MLTKHDERKMPKNLGHIESLARSYTDTAIKTLAGIMMETRGRRQKRKVQTDESAPPDETGIALVFEGTGKLRHVIRGD